MSEALVTIFKDILSVNDPKYITVDTALQRIREGKSKAKVEEIRTCLDKEKRNKLKNNLPCVVFGGSFGRRAENALIQASGFMVLDFDNVEDPEQLAKTTLPTHSFIYAAWVSPSGTGVKALVKIADPTKYRLHFAALAKDFPGIDESGKDMVRVAFESYDPHIYINTNATTYTKILEVKYENTKVQTTKVVEESRTIYTKLRTWLENRGCHFAQGNRNNYITRLAAACNRFGIASSDALSLIQQDFLRSDSDFTQKEIERSINGIYTRFKSTHATAEFEQNTVVDKTTRKEVQSEVLDMESEPKDIIYLNDVKEDLLHDFKHGTQKGETTYFESIDKHFRWMRGEVTMFGGIPNHGKSTLLMQLELIKCIKENKKAAVFSPETNPPLFFYRELIRTMIGRPIERYVQDHMSLEEFEYGMKHIQDMFYFIYPKNAAPTPCYILDRFLEMIIKKNVDIVTIDPINQLDNDWQKYNRDDQYWSVILNDFKRFALDNNPYFVIVGHPTKMHKEKDGNYPAPDIYNYAGGAMLPNKLDNIICWHRPEYSTNKDNPMGEFRSQKIKKQSLNGHPGMCQLDYDRWKGRFYENGNSPFNEKKPTVHQAPIDYTVPITEASTIDLPF